MIGVFDSGHGGLTVLRALAQKFPHINFLYLGDHANAPYGNRPSDEVVALTRAGVERLFERGCRLVVLGCNTATSIACRSLQQDWLPGSQWAGRNVLGIIAPTVEVATQTPWGVTEPQYPQMYKSDVIAVFATQRTIESGVYGEEIKKRCPLMQVVTQACPQLAGLIEDGADEAALNELIRAYVDEMLQAAGEAGAVTDGMPHYAILGCTHYPLVEHMFARHLPKSCRLLSQPQIVADSLEHYLARHPEYQAGGGDASFKAGTALNGGSTPRVRLLTTGALSRVEARSFMGWQDRPAFEVCAG